MTQTHTKRAVFRAREPGPSPLPALSFACACRIPARRQSQRRRRAVILRGGEGSQGDTVWVTAWPWRSVWLQSGRGWCFAERRTQFRTHLSESMQTQAPWPSPGIHAGPAFTQRRGGKRVDREAALARQRNPTPLTRVVAAGGVGGQEAEGWRLAHVHIAGTIGPMAHTGAAEGRVGGRAGGWVRRCCPARPRPVRLALKRDQNMTRACTCKTATGGAPLPSRAGLEGEERSTRLSTRSSEAPPPGAGSPASGALHGLSASPARPAAVRRRRREAADSILVKSEPSLRTCEQGGR